MAPEVDDAVVDVEVAAVDELLAVAPSLVGDVEVTGSDDVPGAFDEEGAGVDRAVDDGVADGDVAGEEVAGADAVEDVAVLALPVGEVATAV